VREVREVLRLARHDRRDVDDWDTEPLAQHDGCAGARPPPTRPEPGSPGVVVRDAATSARPATSSVFGRRLLRRGGGTVIKHKSDGFTHTIEDDFGATHRVVPGCPNAQAEAESLHSRIEPEFFDIEDFAGPFDFWNKIATWQNWYNLQRKNSSRGWKSPAENLREIQPQCDTAIFLLPPVHVDILLAAQGGYYLPVDPDTSEVTS
jgi:hypothetical protein